MFEIFLDCWNNSSLASGAFDVIGQLAALRRYARSLVRNSDDAEDLVHDALLRAYEKKQSFRRGGNLRTWLLSILHNAHIDRIRQDRSLARRHDEAAVEAEQSLQAGQEPPSVRASGRY